MSPPKAEIIVAKPVISLPLYIRKIPHNIQVIVIIEADSHQRNCIFCPHMITALSSSILCADCFSVIARILSAAPDKTNSYFSNSLAGGIGHEYVVVRSIDRTANVESDSARFLFSILLLI